jgi:hypothetical protein
MYSVIILFFLLLLLLRFSMDDDTSLDISQPSISGDSLNEPRQVTALEPEEIVVITADDPDFSQSEVSLSISEGQSPSPVPQAEKTQAPVERVEVEKEEEDSERRGSRSSVFESLTPEELKRRMKDSFLDQKEFLSFSKWIVCFCVVAFDIEIGQGLITIIFLL